MCTRPATKFGYDDKPAITVDSKGRVYVAWSRLLKSRYQTTVVSSSADGGKTWSEPQVVDHSLVQPQLVTIAAAGQGDDLYIAGVDARDGLWIGRSTDAGRHFAVRQAAPLPGNIAATCIVFGKFVLPQQAVRCLGPNPTLAVSKQRVFLTYGVVGPDKTQDVDVAVFDRALRPLSRGRAGPADPKKSDQFWPVSAVDPVTSGPVGVLHTTPAVTRSARRPGSRARSRPTGGGGRHRSGPPALRPTSRSSGRTPGSTATAILGATAATPVSRRAAGWPIRCGSTPGT